MNAGLFGVLQECDENYDLYSQKIMHISSPEPGTQFQRFITNLKLGILVPGYTMPKPMKAPVDECAWYKPYQ